MKPSILIIHCHDLGDYLGCYGTPVRTPNIDYLGRDGVIFDNHFTAGTVCSPSRASLMTGCYPHTHGLMGLTHRGWELDARRHPPLPLLLRKAGYDTALFGVQHEHPDPRALGYNYASEVRPYFSEKVAPAFIRWLADRESVSRPFFASVGFFEPHRMGLCPSHFKRDAYRPASPASVHVRPYLPDLPCAREDLSWFYGAVEHLDQQAGSILLALKAKGILDKMILVFTTDHGASFLHSKATLYDGGVKTAFIMRAPCFFKGNRRISALTSHVDFLPTLAKLTGLPLPKGVEGSSFLDALQGKPSKGREYVFAENNYTNYFDPGRMVRSRDFKYIRKGLRTCIFDNQIPEIEQSPLDFRKLPEVFRFYSPKRHFEELYDLRNDPAEMKNKAGSAKYRSVLLKMRKILAMQMKKTKDPFRDLKIDILMPDGYRNPLP